MREYILLVNMFNEYRIVEGRTISELRPMLDLDFFPANAESLDKRLLEDYINEGITPDLEDLIQEIIDHDDMFETFKRLENCFKGKFAPIEVKILYQEQVNYKSCGFS